VSIIDASTDSTNVAAAAQFSATAAVNQANTANVLTHGATSAAGTRTTVKFTITISEATSRSVAVSTAGGVKMLSTLSGTDKDSAGVTTLTQSDSTATPDIVFYAWTKSTTAGTVVISNAGNSKTVYLAGVSTFAYKLNLTSTASAALGGKIIVSGTVKDAFGNDLTSPYVAADFVTSTVGATAGFTAAFTGSDTFLYTAATKTYSWAFTAPATATPVAVQVSMFNGTTSKTPVSVTAFGTPVTTAFFTVNAVDLVTRVAALEAQVAALTADYNALAAKWNKRVASKKAPKKAVATK
jgi:hypothetical protein